MKKLLSILSILTLPVLVYAQDPATDKRPLTHNYDNKLIFCGTTDCSGNGVKDWEWDCIMGCAKVGDVFVNMSETDCMGVKRSAYDVMSNGKPLMILWEGWDCGNCHAGAGKVGDFINKNKDKFNFWMAFGGIGGGAVCGAASNNKTPDAWINKYPAFANAFSFLDNDNTYIYNFHSLPQYSLIDPNTKKFVYRSSQNEGNDPWGRMVTAADKLIATITSNEQMNFIEEMKIYPNPAMETTHISISLSSSVLLRVYMVDVFGKEVLEVFNGTSIGINKDIDMSNIPSGVYFVNTIVDGKKLKSSKLTVQ